MFLLLALRQDIGYDYENYVEMYNNNFIPIEPLSGLLTSFSFLFNDYRYYFMIFAFLTIFLVRKVAIMNNSVVFMMLYLFLPGFFLESFTLVRQSLAISFVIYALSLYMNNKRFYWIPLVLACLTHFSAILFYLTFIVLISVKNKKLRYMIILSILLISFYFAVMLQYLIPYFPKLIWYNGVNQYGFGQFILYLSLFSIISYKLFAFAKTYFNIVLIGLCFMFAGLNIDGVFIRLTYYFLIPFLFYRWNYIFSKQKINSAFWLSIFLVFFIYSLKLKTFNDTGSLTPYKSFILN